MAQDLLVIIIQSVSTSIDLSKVKEHGQLEVQKSNNHIGNKSKIKKNEIIQNNNFFRGGVGFESPNKHSNNIQDYDILPNTSKEGYVDTESSTRKRQPKTAVGGKRSIVIINFIKIQNISKSKKTKENPVVGSRMLYDSKKA